MATTPDTVAALAEARRLAAPLEAENARLEEPHRRAFEAFYRDLPRRHGTYFVFFTSGLLHWVVRCLSFLSDEVPVALVGSALDEGERAMAAGLGRPFHHIDLAVDDNTPLDFLAGIADGDFGWLHIDCFILNPGLLAEMAVIPDDVAVNCVWTSATWGEVEIPHSALLYVNHRALADVRRQGLAATPRAFHYAGGRRGRNAPRDSARALVPGDAEIEVLSRRVPAGEDDLPAYPPGHDYFPVFSVLTALTTDLGYRVGQVRRLDRGSGSLFDQYSDEIVHVNGVGTYRQVYRQRADEDPDLPLVRFYPQLLQMDHVALCRAGEAVGPEVPELYRRRRDELEGELDRLCIAPGDVPENTFEFLVTHGLRGDTAIRLVAD